MREAADGLIAGRYRATRKIGEGAIGEVWEGVHAPLGIKIAIKRLLPAHLNNHELIARFRREAYLLGRARSEHVARVIDFVADDASSGPALIMEFIDGESLYEVLQRRLLSVEEAVSLGADVLTGLDELHRAQVVHRDLKPGNVIIEGRARGGRRAVIVDFGMGRIITKGAGAAGGDGDDEPTGITRNGIALGTLEYMAPEQILNSRGVTGAADLYALGAILFRALTGRFPFSGDSPMALVRAKLTDEAPPLVLARGDALAQGLVQVVARALSRDLGRRYASAEEMLAHLHELRAHIPPSQAIFASSPAARPSHEPPPLSIPPPPSLPSLHHPRPSRAAPSFGPMLDDDTIEMPPGGRRGPAGSTPAAGSMAAVPAPTPSRPRPPAYAATPDPPPFGPPPAAAGPHQAATSTGSRKVLGLTALAFFGMLVGGGLGLVYVVRREAAPPAADTPAEVAEAPPPPAPVASDAPKAAASPAPEAHARPAGSAGAKNVVDLADLPPDPAGPAKPARPRGGR